ncbi:serine/arginine-rich 22 [Striga asiatica]|uniref:Serine/arginine-rich 22 n=1 Tax=Striga asiatica TaxID=4170 RepID=A0A5A7QCA2_STRAF|nr:serine/arginine-rich 22 [Striga asiatica]
MLAAAVADRRNTAGGRFVKNLTCYTCGKTGQIAVKCFEVISHPKWWGTGDSGRGNGSGRGGGQSGGGKNGVGDNQTRAHAAFGGPPNMLVNGSANRPGSASGEVMSESNRTAISGFSNA